MFLMRKMKNKPINQAFFIYVLGIIELLSILMFKFNKNILDMNMPYYYEMDALSG